MAIGNNGGSNYLSRTANLPTLASLTVSGWWEFTQTTGTQGIYWLGGGSTDYVYIYQTGNQLKVEGKFGGGATLRSVTSTTTFATGDIVWFGVRAATTGTMQFYTSRGGTVTSEGTATWGGGSTAPTSCSVLTKNTGSDLANGYLHGLKVHQGALDTYRITLEPNFGAFTHLPGTPCLGCWPMFSPTDVADVGGFDAGSWTVTGTLLQSAKSAPWSLAPSFPITQRSTNYITGAGAIATAESVGSPTVTLSISGAGAIATAESVGAPTATQNIAGAGSIATAEVVGGPTATQNVTGAGAIATTESVGSPTTTLTVSGAGAIATAETVGAPTATQNVTGAGAIATAELVGSPAVGASISGAGGITSSGSIGTPTVGLSISNAGGISSLENVGSPAVTQIINRAGNIASGESVGQPTVNFGATALQISDAGGITTAELVGLPIVWTLGGIYYTLANLMQSHFATRIATKLGIPTQFDNAQLADIIETGEDAGVGPPVQNILDCGAIDSGEIVGQPTAYLTMTGAGLIGSNENVGGPAASLSVSGAGGVGSLEVVGAPTMFFTGAISNAGNIASAENVGSPVVSLAGGPGADTGSAIISLKTPPSICWDRVTLRAYIGFATTFYMPAVTFQYRVTGSSTWISTKPIYRCAHWRKTNYYREITGLAQNTDYDFRCTVADISTGTLLNYSENVSQAVTGFRTRPSSDSTQVGNRLNLSGVTQATYALHGDPTSGLITKTNRRQFKSVLQRLNGAGAFPFDMVVFGTDNPSGFPAGTVKTYNSGGTEITSTTYANNFMERAITNLAQSCWAIGLEGFDGTRATYTAPEQALLDATGGPNGTGYRPIYRDSSTFGCDLGDASGATWGAGVPIVGLSIIGADLTQPSKLATYSSTDTDNFVAHDPAITLTWSLTTNCYAYNLKYASQNGNTARLGGVGITDPVSQDSGATAPTGLLGFKNCEFRGLGENWSTVGSTVANENGRGTKTHNRLFGDCRFDYDGCVFAYANEHYVYHNGVGTALSGVDDSWMLGCTDRPGLRSWQNPNDGSTRQPLQGECRANPDAFKCTLKNGIALGGNAFHVYHRALVNGQDYDATHGWQDDFVDGAPSEASVIVDGCNFNGRVLTSTGVVTVNTGASTFTTASTFTMVADMPVNVAANAMPGGFTTASTYFVVNLSNGNKTFQLAARPASLTGGTPVPITITSAGTSVSIQSFENIGASTTVDGANPIIYYGNIGKLSVTNTTLGRGNSLSLITNSGKGHYMMQHTDGMYYASGELFVDTTAVAGDRTYSNAAVCAVSCAKITVNSIDNRGASRRAISLNDDLSDGKNGNGDASFGPTDDGFTLDENGQFRCGQSSGSALWGSQTKIEWELNNGANFIWSNTQVDHSVAGNIVRDLAGTAALGTFPNP